MLCSINRQSERQLQNKNLQVGGEGKEPITLQQSEQKVYFIKLAGGGKEKKPEQ